VVVRIQLPPKTRGFFSVRVGRDADDLPLERRKRELFLQRLRRGLRRIGRFEQHMVGRESVFRWIPARKRSYTVTVRGPLFDAMGEDVIGHFLEQRPVRVQRGRSARVEFDFDPKEVAVEVSVRRGGRPVAGARVAREGVPGSLRYARDGSCFLVLPRGRHRILVGAADRVAAVALEIASLRSAIQLPIDLDAEEPLVVRDCPAAVDPYLAGDLPGAAAALEAAGRAREAHLARAAHLEARGDREGAAQELCAAGELEAAAALRAGGSDHRGAADLFERAGDLARAAETWRAAGDLAAAARCYEGAYQYQEALECYREVGDEGKALEILEKTGEWLEAARAARALGDAERAVRSLQQIGARDDAHPEACVLMARILSERGDFELAVAKLEEALRGRRGDPPPELQKLYAELCERAGQREKAAQAYTDLRRLDPASEEAAARLEALRSAPGQRSAPAAAGESRYELLSEIGRGGMGVVYEARDRRLGRLVALKRLPESLREHPAAVELFRREARAAAALNHPNIVTVYDADEEGGAYFITMELLQGRPLSAILARHGRVAPRDAARLALQVCAGLHYAAERRIVHRDIKTGNLFFTRDRVVKIMDFGLAKTLEEVRRSSTVIGGTPTHMAPEQAAGEAVDARTDLYALGVTLFELLTGEPPFAQGDLAYHHRHTPPPDPRELVPGLPGPLAELVLALLAKRPDDRPASAAEVGARLQALLAARPAAG
jgi:serine/threonine-protein kinase